MSVKFFKNILKNPYLLKNNKNYTFINLDKLFTHTPLPNTPSIIFSNISLNIKSDISPFSPLSPSSIPSLKNKDTIIFHKCNQYFIESMLNPHTLEGVERVCLLTNFNNNNLIPKFSRCDTQFYLLPSLAQNIKFCESEHFKKIYLL